MATNLSQDDFHKTGLRLPRDLHAKLHEAAAAAGRSYNSEIIARLEASFTQTGETENKGEVLSALAKMAADQSEILLALQGWKEVEKAIVEGRATAVPKGMTKVPKRKPAE